MPIKRFFDDSELQAHEVPTNPEDKTETVILPIHEAFKADITDSTEKTEVKTTGKTAVKTGMKTTEKSAVETNMPLTSTESLPVNLPVNLPENLTETAKKIYCLLSENGKYTYDHLASVIGMTRETVRVSIRSLVDAGLIRRVGPDKGGHWEVV